MQYREELPGEPIQWSHTEQYAKELIDEGIISKEEVDFNLSMFRGDQSEEAYNWLVKEASTRHLKKFGTGDHFEDWPFLVFDQDEARDPEEELDELLENTYLGPIKKRKVGQFALRACGNFSVLYVMYRVAVRFSEKGNFFSKNIIENVAELTLLSMGIIAVKESLKDN